MKRRWSEFGAPTTWCRAGHRFKLPLERRGLVGMSPLGRFLPRFLPVGENIFERLPVLALQPVEQG